MLSKTMRALVLSGALALVGGPLVANADAGGFNVTQKFVNWVVSGSLTPKTLNEPVTLPEGSTFNGSVNLELPAFTGPVTGKVFVPPFNATIPIAGIPTTVGVTFTEVGNIKGALTRAPTGSCAPAEPSLICVTLSSPTLANIGITELGTEVGPLGVSTTTNCQTIEPMTLDLSTNVTVKEFFEQGAHFTGDTTIPPIACEGIEGLVLGPALTLVMSGPDNPYSLTIAPPAKK